MIYFAPMIRPGIRFFMLSTVFYAIMNTCVKYMPHIPAHEIIFFRCIISLAASYTHLRMLNIPVMGNNKVALILRGIFGLISLTAFFITLQRMPLATAVTIQYLSPVFTLLFAIFILGERPRLVQFLFFLISFVGVVVACGFDRRISAGDFFLGLTSAVFSGLGYNMVRKSRATEHPLVVVFYFPLVALPFMAVWTATDWVMPTGWDWLLLLIVGASTQAAQVCMTLAYHQEKASSVSGLQYLGLIYSLLVGYFLFNEGYGAMSLLGMLLIVAGILVNYFYERWQAKYA